MRIFGGIRFGQLVDSEVGFGRQVGGIFDPDLPFVSVDQYDHVGLRFPLHLQRVPPSELQVGTEVPSDV